MDKFWENITKTDKTFLFYVQKIYLHVTFIYSMQ